MSTLEDTIWPEKYRAKTIDQLILPDRLIAMFNRILERPLEFPNMMFYSPAPGVFKTTAAEVLCNEMKKRYSARFQKINASMDGSKDTIRGEIEEWSTFNGFSKSPSIIILDEFDKSSKTTFQDPLLSSIEKMNKASRFIMTSNSLINFSEYADSRVETIDFTLIDQAEIIECKRKLYARLISICEIEKVEYDPKTLQGLIKNYFPDFRKMLVKMYSCYLMNGSITGDSFGHNRSFSKYDRINELLIKEDYNACRALYNTMPPETDIFTALMSNFVLKVENPVHQLKITRAIREHMVPHQVVIDKEINIASMFAEIILILKNVK